MSEIIAFKETSTRIITCYNVEADHAYHSDYYISVCIKRGLKVFYSYHEDIEDMFYFYETLIEGNY